MPINNYLVIGVNPANNETTVPVNKRISIAFARDMKQATLTPGTIVLREVNGPAVPYTSTYVPSTKTLGIQPTALLLPGTEYEMQVLSGVNGIRSITDDYLDVPRIYQFKTRQTAAISVPLNLSATVDNGYPVLIWEKPKSFDETSPISYEVKVNKSNLADSDTVWPGSGDINQTNNLRFNIPKKFEASEQYYAYVRALNGPEKSDWVQKQFTVEAPETTPVAPPGDNGDAGFAYFDVTDTYPRKDGVDVTPEQVIVMFSGQVEEESVTAETVYIVKRPLKGRLSRIDFKTDYAPNKRVLGTSVSVDGDTVILEADLEDDAEYTVVVSGTVHLINETKSILGESYAWSFVTKYTQLYGDPSMVRRDLGTLSDSISDRLLYSYLKEASDYSYQVVSGTAAFNAADYANGNAPHYVHEYARLRTSYDIIMNSQMRSGGGGTTTNVKIGDLSVEKDASTGGSVSSTLSGIKQQMKYYLDLMHGHSNRGYAKPVVVVRGENVEAYPDFLTRTEFKELGQ